METKTVTLVKEWKPLIERVGLKFFAGAISGALGALTFISTVDILTGDIDSFADLSHWVFKVVAAVGVGAATGGFEALRKYFEARGDYSN